MVNGLFQTARDYLIHTPHPNRIYSFNPPTNGRWPTIYHLFNEKTVVIMPTLFALAFVLAMFFNIFSKKQKKQCIRRLCIALPFSLIWWWVGGWFLKATNFIAVRFAGDASIAGSLTADAGSTIGALFVLAILYFAGGAIVAVVWFVYLARRIVIFGYMATMPILLMLWATPVGPVSNWAKGLMEKFPPIVLLTLPTAALLKLGAMLLSGGGGSDPVAAAASNPNIGEEIMSMFMGFGTLVSIAVLPKFIFPAVSSQISNAVGSGASAGRSAARGARREWSGTSEGVNGGGGQSAGSPGISGDSSGGSGGSSTDQGNGHTPKTDFSGKQQQSKRRSKRKRRQKRGEKMGAMSAKAVSGSKKLASKAGKGTAKKSINSAGRASTSVIRNKRKDGSTVRGMGSDAMDVAASAGSSSLASARDLKDSAVSEASGRAAGAEKNMKARARQIQEKFTPDPGTKAPTDNVGLDTENGQLDTASGERDRSETDTDHFTQQDNGE